jgi:putative ABC transport system permease protein
MLLRDCRIALRALRRTPGFAATGIVTLAGASGAVTAILAVVGAVLLEPLPVRDQDEIVVAWKEDLASGFAHWPFSYPAVRALQDQLTTVSDLATIDYNGAYPLASVEGDRGVTLPTGIVSGNLMPLLGLTPMLGRTLLASDDVVGAVPVVVISESLWRSRYGADPNVTTRSLRLYGTTYQIVGVVASEFGLPAGAVMWLAYKPFQPQVLEHDDWILADLVVRLKPGHTLEQFRAELDAVRQRTALEAIPAYKAHRVVATQLRDVVVGEAEPTLLLLGAGALLVLVVAAVNLGGLLLVRSGGRMHEIAVRAAIGGGGFRAQRAVLLEYAMVVIAGAALGVPAGWVALRLLGPLLPPELPNGASIGLDPLTASVATVVCLLVGALAVVAPAAALARADLISALKGGGRSSASGWGVHPLRRGMVAVQLALAVTVVAGAGLLLRTLERLQRIDPGFRPEGVLLVEIADARPIGAPDSARTRDEIDRVIDSLRSIPGVTSAGAVLSPPFVGNAGFYMKLVSDEMSAGQVEEIPYSNVDVVVPSSFETLGLKLRRGRLLEPSDREGAARVVVINESLARRLWPGREPVGKRLRPSTVQAGSWATVVGVVADTRYNELRRAAPMAYLSYRQIEWAPLYFVVRSGGGAPLETLAPQLRRAIQTAEPGLALKAATPMTALLAQPLARPRLAAILVTAFGLIVLALSALGIYGVMASFVMQRTREIGVRMALGATGRMVNQLVFRQGMTLSAVGIVAGLLLAAATSRLLRGLLYEVAPLDAATFGSVAVLLLLVAVLAILVPAMKASRLEPVVALRAD